MNNLIKIMCVSVMLSGIAIADDMRKDLIAVDKEGRLMKIEFTRLEGKGIGDIDDLMRDLKY